MEIQNFKTIFNELWKIFFVNLVYFELISYHENFKYIKICTKAKLQWKKNSSKVTFDHLVGTSAKNLSHHTKFIGTDKNGHKSLHPSAISYHKLQ